MSVVVMWIFAIISLGGTVAAVQFMPDTIPTHFDFAGNIDRWGSKWESLLFPALIMLVSLIWTLCIKRSLKKAEGLDSAEGQKEAAFAKANAKTLGIVGAAITALLAAVDGVILYGSYIAATNSGTKALPLVFKLVFALLGIIIVVIGNFMPKTRINGVFGVRVKWSVYNDATWKKTNRFGAFCAVAAGALIVAAAVIFDSVPVLFAVELGLVALSSVAVVIYSRKVYLQEAGAQG
ncbi:MAG: DUF1648 domain-containing protein [Treponema sp.]|nr:DUF1648 domain-containing protein [Treponema sp.]